MRKGLVAANWKMNGLTATNDALLKALAGAMNEEGSQADILICPPSVYLQQAGAGLAGTGIMLGAQNVYPAESGAFTGEVSVPMLRDAGCNHVIVGHSERREIFSESDSFIAEKFIAAQGGGLVPLLCVGETQEQREAGRTGDTVLGQLDVVVQAAGIGAFSNAVIAYEPVWAIGTGLTATPEQAQVVHALIRNRLAESNPDVAAQVRILYGGSVKGANARELFVQPDIDGALVGGASLVAEEFLKICRSYG